jgi:Ca2+-binding EF-hand superfamily protein
MSTCFLITQPICIAKSYHCYYKNKIHFSDDDDQKKQFKIADTDGDGLLSPDELKKFLIKCGVKPQNDIIQQMIKDVDSDGDGKISYAEYKILCSDN